MQSFTLYDGAGMPVQIEMATTNNTSNRSTTANLKHIVKLCSNEDRIFLLSEQNELYSGASTKRPICSVSFVRGGIVDIECTATDLYAVDESGSVYRRSAAAADDDGEWTEIVVPNRKTCPHGVKSTTEKVRIAKINCNLDGILFTTQTRELYGQGNFADVLQSVDEPVPVECFGGLDIIQVSMGDHFAAVLTQKKPIRSMGNGEDDCCSDGGDGDSDASSPVYLNTECEKCAPDTSSAIMASAAAEPSNDATSLMMLRPPSTTETSMASSGSQSDVFELDDDAWRQRQRANQSPSTILIDDTTTGESMKSHKETAINFLLESLSITSEDAGKQTKLIKDNVSNITSIVREGVRTLSRHMSGSDTNETTFVETDPLTASLEELLLAEKSLKVTVAAAAAAAATPTTTAAAAELSDCYDSVAEDSSMGIGSVIDLQSECELENKITKICRAGANMLGTSVWCFGSVNKGHLGTGDHVKRTRINPVLGLTGQGVVKIASGREHSVALTLDGKGFFLQLIY